MKPLVLPVTLVALLMTVTSLASAVSLPAPKPSSSTKSAIPLNLCSSLKAAIDFDEKRLSKLSWDEIGDDSAPRATMRNTESAAIYEEITANILQLKANDCAPFSEVIASSKYIDAAAQCSAAETTAHTAALMNQDVEANRTKMAAACNMTSWTVEN